MTAGDGVLPGQEADTIEKGDIRDEQIPGTYHYIHMTMQGSTRLFEGIAVAGASPVAVSKKPDGTLKF